MLDFKELKIGSKFVESEYGSHILLEVISEPKLEREDYLTFKAEIVSSSPGNERKGEVVDYGFQYPSSAYNPTIWSTDIFPMVFTD